MNTTPSERLHDYLGRLFTRSFGVSSPLEMLYLIREKLQADDEPSVYKQEILDELGRLQRLSRELNSEMLRIYEFLQQEV